MSFAINIHADHHSRSHPTALFGTKVVLALIAVMFLTLTTAALETRLGALPSDPTFITDSAE
jgi:hypothetical protein